MSRARPYRSRWLWIPALAASTIAQGAALVTYEATRPTPPATLTIRLQGAGDGQVLVTRVGDRSPIERCSQPICHVSLPPGTEVHLTAVLGEDATFAGYRQFPMRTPAALLSVLGDPLAKCVASDDPAADSARDALDCPLTLHANTDVAAEFGEVPKEVTVALGDLPPMDKVIQPLTPPKPAPIVAEKLDEKPLIVAIAPPKLPPPPPIPPPPPPPKDQPKPPPPPDTAHMTAVEVHDKQHEVDKAPDDAKLLSDKNHDVDVETRAKETNLDKESQGQAVASKESDDHTSKEVGGPDDKIHQLEDTDKTTDQHLKETDHSGHDETAKGVIRGEGGNSGEEGTGVQHEPGLMSMRDIGGRGAITDQADGRKAGKRGTPGLNTPLTSNDYERIMGKESVDEERQVAARKMSSHKGRWERKLDAIKSSLENFVPDIQTGNQTALKTRAHPFALYLARMHRRIHELWGFGFLEQLDARGANDPLNDANLWVNIEMSINPDGTVHKVTIAKTSGKTEFDVAAVDTVITAGPYEETPDVIRSVDGRVYLRWGFYRNWRQCGTFNAEPYILTSVPTDSGQGVLDGDQQATTPHVPGTKHKPLPTGDKPVTPDDGLANKPVSPTSSVTDKQALFAANLWVSAFATAEVDKLVKYSNVPFYAGGTVAAQTPGDLKDMYSGLVVESGPMRDWKLLTPAEYGGNLPAGNVVLQVHTTKTAFAIVLTKTPSGDWHASQLAR